jgi:hypothetical protein
MKKVKRICLNCTYEKKHWCFIKKYEVGLMHFCKQWTRKTNRQKRTRMKVR